MALGVLDADDSIFTCCLTWAMLLSGMATNILALYLAIHYSHRNIGKYRYILYCFLVHNMAFTLINALADWYIYIESDTLLIVGSTLPYIPQIFDLFLLIAQVCLFFNSVTLSTGQIIHRYLIICNKIKEKQTFRVGLVIMFISITIVVFWTIWLCLIAVFPGKCLRIDDDDYEFLNSTPICSDFIFALEKRYDLSETVFVAVPVGKTMNKSSSHVPIVNSIALFSVLCFLIFAAMIITVLCTVLMFRNISSGLHSRQRKLQTQMIKALLGQALIPILLLQSPLFLSCLVVGLSNSIDGAFQVLYFTCGCYPTIQGIGLIIGVESYRIRCLSFIFKTCHWDVSKIKESSSTTKEKPSKLGGSVRSNDHRIPPVQ